MRKGCNYTATRIHTDVAREGQSLEEFLSKAIQGKEPIQATAKVTYNERKDGVLPQHDIRTDRFEVAMLATDKIHASQAAARKKVDFPEMTKEDAIDIAKKTGAEA